MIRAYHVGESEGDRSRVDVDCAALRCASASDFGAIAFCQCDRLSLARRTEQPDRDAAGATGCTEFAVS